MRVTNVSITNEAITQESSASSFFELNRVDLYWIDGTNAMIYHSIKDSVPKQYPQNHRDSNYMYIVL